MVKAVIGEEIRLRSLEDRLSESGTSVEVGLVIGKLSSYLDRGFVFDLVPTPNNDAGEPPASIIGGGGGGGGKDEKKKKGGVRSKGVVSDLGKEVSVLIDKDWVAEHARQVSQMLVGGIKVVGIYVWTSDTAFKNSTMELCQTVRGAAQTALLSVNDWEERLLMHICYSPRRWTCRTCTLASNITSSSLRPCDFKMGKVFNSLQGFRCMYNLDLRLPILHQDISRGRTLNDILHDGIAMHVKELKGSKAASDDEPCTSDGLHEVELLLPFMRDASVEASSGKRVAGILQLTGYICSYAYLSSKEPTSQALDYIKDDIITSLRTRLAIISDEGDGEVGKNADGGTEPSDVLTAAPSIDDQLLQPLGLRKSCIVPLPRRVFIPWMAGTLISNYLQPSETFEVLTDQLAELLSMEPVDPSTVIDPETEPLNLTTSGSFWDAVAAAFPAPKSHSIKTAADEGGKDSSRSGTSGLKNVNSMITVLILLFSVLAGLMLFSKSHR
ncbi:odr-4-like protein [Drosera capensis]